MLDLFSKSISRRTRSTSSRHHPPILLYRTMSRLIGKCLTLHTHMHLHILCNPRHIQRIALLPFLFYRYNFFFFASCFRMPLSLHSHDTATASVLLTLLTTLAHVGVTIRVAHVNFSRLTLPSAQVRCFRLFILMASHLKGRGPPLRGQGLLQVASEAATAPPTKTEVRAHGVTVRLPNNVDPEGSVI